MLNNPVEVSPPMKKHQTFMNIRIIFQHLLRVQKLLSIKMEVTLENSGTFQGRRWGVREIRMLFIAKVKN